MTEVYAGLDISDKATHICAVDKDGKVIWRGVCATDTEALASNLTKHCPGLVRVVFETGPLSSFLYHGLVERSLPVVCVCARHAKGALSVQVNKSDVNDAYGLAQIARTGWYTPNRLRRRTSRNCGAKACCLCGLRLAFKQFNIVFHRICCSSGKAFTRSPINKDRCISR